MNEAQHQQKIEHVMTLYRWRWYHTHDSRRSPAGFPDLVAVKGTRVLYVELKQDGKYPTAAQRDWLRDLYRAGQEVAVWKPKDMPTILRCLGPAQEPLHLDVRYR